MVNPYITSMEVSGILASAILIVCFGLALIRIFRGPKVKFLMQQCLLLIISNSVFIVYISLYNIRRTAVSHQTKNALLLVILSMLFDYIHYVCLFVCMWQFAFKYWVVAVEVPKVIQELDQSFRATVSERSTIQKTNEENRVKLERQYKIIWFIGIISNTVMCTWYQTEYYKTI